MNAGIRLCIVNEKLTIIGFGFGLVEEELLCTKSFANVPHCGHTLTLK